MAFQQDNHLVLFRIRLLKAATAVILLGLSLQLWYLAVVNAEFYRDLARRNQIRTLSLVAPRGLVMDRNGTILVDNIPNFNLYLIPEDISYFRSTRDFLLEAFDHDNEFVAEKLQEAFDSKSSSPYLILKDLSIAEISFILSRRSEHPEISVMEQPKRRYRFGMTACHVLGYVGEISKTELEQGEFSGSRGGDIVGKAGIERTFNRQLTGKNGTARVLVNSVGRILRELSRREPVAGNQLVLTLDLELQILAEQALEDDPGAVVALNPKTGEILVLASRPGFDPNLFASRLTGAQWRALSEDPLHPLQNRAIQSAFSPGSIFKVIMILAGLESGVVDPSTTVYCSGSTKIYGRTFHCWNAGGHGRVNYHQAIQHSCNIYFYMLGQKLGIDRISRFSRLLGLGNITGIDIGNEVPGIIPSREWKRRVMGEPWYPGETISVSIGQGPLNVTPLQLARAMGMVATGLAPQLHCVRPSDPESAPLTVADLGFSPENLRRVRQAMWSVVNEYGTGKGAQVAHFDVCGKTGTAQLVSRETLIRLPEEDRRKFEPNAWFVGFAPLDDPEIVVAVIVQRGGSGSSGAAPIAGQIFRRYYERKQERKALNVKMAMAVRP